MSERVVDAVDNSGMDGGCMSRSVDVVDDQPLAHGVSSETIQSDSDRTKVRAAEELFDGDDVYRIQDNPRGICLIINNIKFHDPHHHRHGTEDEREAWQSTFRLLGFEVSYIENLTASKMLEVFDLYRQKVKANHNAFVGVVLSHGRPGSILGIDDIGCSVDEIVEKFNNEQCRSLIGKPKMFFFQACRGDKEDFGVDDPFNIIDGREIVIPVAQTGQKVPTWTDMVICYSTIHGHVANRHLETGSWFADALLSTINEHAWNTELNEIFMKVSDNLVCLLIFYDNFLD